MANLRPPTPSVVLLPGFKGLQGVDIPNNVKQMAPQQVVVEEPQSGAKCKRLVVPLVLCGDISFQVQDSGAIPVASTKFAEVVLEAHAGLLNQQSSQIIQEHPLEGFKRPVASSGISMQEVSILCSFGPGSC